jgi:hypothetical protein
VAMVDQASQPAPIKLSPAIPPPSNGPCALMLARAAAAVSRASTIIRSVCSFKIPAGRHPPVRYPGLLRGAAAPGSEHEALLGAMLETSPEG